MSEPRDELWLHVPDALCADPCPEAPDLLPCLLERGHEDEWHRNRSSSWPVAASQVSGAAEDTNKEPRAPAEEAE